MQRYFEFKNFFKDHISNGLNVLCIESTEGSTYRKKGSIKLVANSGVHTGLLSGGCLEEEIVRVALDTGSGQHFSIDTRSDEDKYFGSGKGCQGLLNISVIELASDTQWHTFCKIYFKHIRFPCLHVVGAGADVLPLAGILDALQMSWFCADYRKAHVDRFLAYSNSCKHVAAGELRRSLLDIFFVKHVSDNTGLFAPAYVLMSHSFEYDLEGLLAAVDAGAEYVGVLGPKRRRDELVKAAQNELDGTQPDYDWGRVHGPMGVPGLGRGEEAIAVSIVAEVMRAFAS